jgi:predicted membrane-bound mannosyltransferase
MTPRSLSFWTDNRGAWDTGRVIVPLAVLAMIAISAFDVVSNGRAFNAQDLGVGVGAVLAGFAAYLYGDKSGGGK